MEVQNKLLDAREKFRFAKLGKMRARLQICPYFRIRPEATYISAETLLANRFASAKIHICSLEISNIFE